MSTSLVTGAVKDQACYPSRALEITFFQTVTEGRVQGPLKAPSKANFLRMFLNSLNIF